jgi:hypothetical protein
MGNFNPKKQRQPNLETNLLKKTDTREDQLLSPWLTKPNFGTGIFERVWPPPHFSTHP